MPVRLFPLLLILLVVPVSPGVSAQAEFLFDFVLTVPTDTTVEIAAGVQYEVRFTLQDKSRDSTNIVPGAPATPVIAHDVKFRLTPGYDDSNGWIVTQPSPFLINPGETVETTFSVIPDFSAQNPYYKALINATITTEGGTFYREASMAFFTKGIAGFQAQAYGPPEIGAREVALGSVRLSNVGVLPRVFNFEVANNPCEYKVAPPPGVTVAPRTTVEVPFSILGPDTNFNPLGLLSAPSCSSSLWVYAADNPGLRSEQSISIKVAQGITFDPMVFFWALIVAAVFFLLILFLRRRKERIEERILGKPQKPWTIPVEQVYLRELKARDPRAWYVVRHYLMEEEYKSSLLWFKAYKAATKGDRKKERVVLKQEAKYESWKVAWAKAIAKPVRTADRYEAQLQRKLERGAKAAFRKAGRKHRNLTAKITAARAKLHKRAMEKWEKQRAKAEKKGRPIPPEPVASAPNLPLAPVLATPLLADHKWAKRAARYRRRMVRKQGNLEVKFEKADARYLARLRRKMGRLARKLDDPDFVAEHPLLRGETTPR